MGLGEGVGWQREGAEGPQLVTLFIYQDCSYSHRPSWWEGGGGGGCLSRVGAGGQ